MSESLTVGFNIKASIGKKKNGMFVGMLDLIQDGIVIRNITTEKEYADIELHELKALLKIEAEELARLVEEVVKEVGGIITSQETVARE